MDKDIEPTFLTGEQCCRCGGPLLTEPYLRTEFIEESLDYIQLTYWPCYACGLGNVVGESEPHYHR